MPDQRQQLAIKIKTRSQHTDRLKWFARATGIHRCKVGTDRGGQTPVWIGDGHPPAMDAFDESVADHLNQHRIRFEGADHALTLRSDHGAKPLVPRWANAVVSYAATGLATL